MQNITIKHNLLANFIFDTHIIAAIRKLRTKTGFRIVRAWKWTHCYNGIIASIWIDNLLAWLSVLQCSFECLCVTAALQNHVTSIHKMNWHQGIG